MKIVCTQDNLKNGLGLVSRVSGNSLTLPILNNILLETENGLLKMSVTNLEIGISTYVRCKVEETGSICLNSKTLNELINTLPNSNITINSNEVETNISTDNYQTKVKHLSAEDFPLIPSIEDFVELTLEAEVLKNAIDSVIFAVSNSETQPEMSGVFLAVKNKKLIFAGTDRYRLAEKIIDLDIDTQNELDSVIPQKTMIEVSRLLTGIIGPVTLKISNNQIAFNINDTYVISRLIEGQYPDYKQIIPENHDTSIFIDKKSLLNALKTSGIFSKNSGSVNINYDEPKQTLDINSVQSNIGESSVQLECKITGLTGDLTINYRYLLEVLPSIESELIEIRIINDSHPVVIYPEGTSNYLYLVMPLKI